MKIYKENGAVFDCAVFEESLARLGVSVSDVSIKVYKTTVSTNDDAERQANKKIDTPYTIFVADEQTGGKGRLGRSFFSKEGGLYMSILVRGPLAQSFALDLTSLVGVALSKAIEKLTKLLPKIKWVNDIYLNDRKLAGILAKGRLISTDKDEPRLEYAVVGIGVNLTTADFPEELRDIAISLCEISDTPPAREELCAVVTAEILSLLDKIGSPYIADEYRKRSYLDGRRVRIIESEREYYATVLGISDKCELIVDRDGERLVINSADVSVKF